MTGPEPHAIRALAPHRGHKPQGDARVSAGGVAALSGTVRFRAVLGAPSENQLFRLPDME